MEQYNLPSFRTHDVTHARSQPALGTLFYLP